MEEPKFCEPCEQAGKGHVPAVRWVMSNGRAKGLCAVHSRPYLSEGLAMSLPVSPPVVAADAEAETKQEEGTMPKAGPKGETREKVRELWNKGLTDRQISEQLDMANSVAVYHRKKLGLPPNPGRNVPHDGGAVGRDRETHTVPHRKQPKPAKHEAPRETVSISLTAEALDAIWNGLSIETKARLIERLWAS